ncbi:MAG TPA: D-alanyl-D-alanine carboxypeptidase family protein [Stellaceae bacterium]|nr:D-alanyl-D-alanine carboxypeptidase family protein [Stellaceae bacterium]
MTRVTDSRFSAISLMSRALVLVALLLMPSIARAQIDTDAKYVYIVDAKTGTVLMDKGGEERMAPASMSKIMTAYLVFDQLKQGKLSLTDELTVSEKAWRMGGSKMFVPLGAHVKVEDLIRGMLIQSGNDACIVLAEGIAGSEEAFALMMNKKAGDLGLTGSHFANSNGWPDPGDYMTAKDLSTLALHTIRDFPEYYHYFSEKEFVYNGIKQGNRNPLLYKTVGADGLKTGHTDESGFSLTASVVRGEQHIIAVMSGMKSMKNRAQDTDRVIDWAFREFGNYALFKQGDTVDEADVWLGVKNKVPLVAARDVAVTLPKRLRKDMKVTVTYDNPIAAPIAAGQTVGKLVISAPEVPPVEVPLVTGAAVDRLGPMGRLGTAVAQLVLGSKR